MHWLFHSVPAFIGGIAGAWCYANGFQVYSLEGTIAAGVMAGLVLGYIGDRASEREATGVVHGVVRSAAPASASRDYRILRCSKCHVRNRVPEAARAAKCGKCHQSLSLV